MIQREMGESDALLSSCACGVEQRPPEPYMSGAPSVAVQLATGACLSLKTVVTPVGAHIKSQGGKRRSKQAHQGDDGRG